MWALALAETVYFLKRSLWLSVIIALAMTILFETAQYFKVVGGTGDIFDVIFVAVSLSIYFLIKKGLHKNEINKKTD